jgi:hypothetical protein
MSADVKLSQGNGEPLPKPLIKRIAKSGTAEKPGLKVAFMAADKSGGITISQTERNYFENTMVYETICVCNTVATLVCTCQTMVYVAPPPTPTPVPTVKPTAIPTATPGRVCTCNPVITECPSNCSCVGYTYTSCSCNKICTCNPVH